MSAELARALRTRVAAEPRAPWLPDPGAAEVSFLASGAYHANYRLRGRGVPDAVLRVATGSQWGLQAGAQLRREALTLEDLAPSGVTPRPLALLAPGPGLDAPVLVEELMEGEAFAYARDLVPLAEAVAAIHTAPVRAAAEVLPRVDAGEFLLADARGWLARAEAAGGEPETFALLRDHERALVEAGPPALPGEAIVHTDLNPGNLIAAPRRCAVVDWEAARRGAPAWDLAHALSPTTTLWDADAAHDLSDGECAAFLAAYARARGVPADEVSAQTEAIAPWVLGRALSWCLGAWTSTPPDRATQPALHGALQRFTRPAFVAARLAELRAHG